MPKKQLVNWGVKRRPKNCPNKVIYLRIDGRPLKISTLILRPAPIVESANNPLAINFAKFLTVVVATQ